MALVVALGIVLFLLLSFKYLIYPALISPLSKIPSAHPTSPFSSIWIRWQRYRNNANKSTQLSHERLGPIVRPGATEISVNDIDAVQIIYRGEWDRDPFYRGFENFGKANMFSMTRRKEHAERRRAFGNVYSKSTLYPSEDFRTIAQSILLQLEASLHEAVKAQEDVEVLELLSIVAMDFVSAYIFGLDGSSTFLEEAETRQKHFTIQQKPGRGWFWTGFGALSGDKTFVSTERRVKDVCLQMLDRMTSEESIRTETKPVVYEQLHQYLCSAIEKYSPSKLSNSLRLTMASELMDHMVAGTETTSWTLVYIFRELSLRFELQRKLRAELLGLTRWSELEIDQAFLRQLDSLQLLNAVVLESLRLNPAVPGSQYRIVPPGSPTILCGYLVPAGTRVSAQAYSLHRSSSIFPSPEIWRPQRWFEASPDHREEMMRWLWAFGSGGRGCIGKDFAMLELKLLVAVVYANFTSSVVDDEGIEQADGYTAGPKSNRLILKFEKVVG
ncbi:related to cytochrome P450 monooxygenase [Phialocephala subalpina]|uniref:Related to cytochrome P450 monooxygenase n=1 Tax=Phialocephala subalpina TaxID=576137 RepID=A0A1L7X1A0_9HELO|nr:related to cytochrome P450 monooxygenase [Phialocephala subalpina]